MTQLERANRLARELEMRFGVSLAGEQVELEGGGYASVRPRDPGHPNGFCIVLVHSPFSVGAQFRLDSFAGALTRSMRESGDDAASLFDSVCAELRASGLEVTLRLDGQVHARIAGSGVDWTTIEVDCWRRRTKPVTASASREALEFEVAQACLQLAFSLMTLEDEEGPAPLGEFEGERAAWSGTRVERSPVNRSRCISIHGCFCACCGFDFEKVYGELGAGYIEVHHLTPVSTLTAPVRVDPRTDLIPLCANCHAMIHRLASPATVAALMASRTP